jgi:hypothetical protein
MLGLSVSAPFVRRCSILDIDFESQFVFSVRSKMPRLGGALPNHFHHAVQRGQLTGSQRFIDQVEAILGRRIENRKQGRQRKRVKKINPCPYVQNPPSEVDGQGQASPLAVFADRDRFGRCLTAPASLRFRRRQLLPCHLT